MRGARLYDRVFSCPPRQPRRQKRVYRTSNELPSLGTASLSVLLHVQIAGCAHIAPWVAAILIDCELAF
jgi:hypothetical protein